MLRRATLIGVSKCLRFYSYVETFGWARVALYGMNSVHAVRGIPVIFSRRRGGQGHYDHGCLSVQLFQFFSHDIYSGLHYLKSPFCTSHTSEQWDHL